MNFAQFRTWTKSVAENTTGINGFIANWVHFIDEKLDNSYPLMLMVPPKDRTPKNESQDSRTYECEFYLLTLKNEATEDEKWQKWGELQALMDQFFKELFIYPTVFVAASVPTHTPDDGQIGADDLVWVHSVVLIKAWKPC